MKNENLRTKLRETVQSLTPHGQHRWIWYNKKEYKKTPLGIKVWKSGREHTEIKLIANGGYVVDVPSVCDPNDPNDGKYVWVQSDFSKIAKLSKAEMDELIDCINNAVSRDKQDYVNDQSSKESSKESKDNYQSSNDQSSNDQSSKESNYQNVSSDMLNTLIIIGKRIYVKGARHDMVLDYGSYMRRILRMNYDNVYAVIDALDEGEKKNHNTVKDIFDHEMEKCVGVTKFRADLKDLFGEKTADDLLSQLSVFTPKMEIDIEELEDMPLLRQMVKDKAARFFKDTEKNSYIMTNNGLNYEIINLKSEDFIDLLNNLYDDATLNAKAVQQHWERQIINSLRAGIKDDPIPLYNRSVWFRDQKTVYYNLNNELGQIYKVTPDGISIVKQSPALILFKKLPNNHEQLMPIITESPNYDDHKLNHKYLDPLTVGIKHDTDKIIFKCWLISLFFGSLSHPIAAPKGGEGSGKSTLLRRSKSIYDPVEDLTNPSMMERTAKLASRLNPDDRKLDDVHTKIWKSSLLILDNVSHISHQLADDLCQWVTGFDSAKHELYTNDGLVEIGGVRPLGITTITLPKLNPDIMSRIWVYEVELPEWLKEKYTEEELWKAFYEMKPEVLGYILKVVSNVLANYDEMRKKIKPKGRLKEWEVLCEVIAQCIGYNVGQFQKAWSGVRDEQVNTVLENDVVAIILLDYILNKSNDAYQNGTDCWIEQTPAEWHKQLKSHGRSMGMVKEGDTQFPEDVSYFAARLYKLAESLKYRKIILEKTHSTIRRIKIDFTNWSGVPTEEKSTEEKSTEDPEEVVTCDVTGDEFQKKQWFSN